MLSQPISPNPNPTLCVANFVDFSSDIVLFESIVLYFWLILSKPRPGERFFYRAACKCFMTLVVSTLKDVVANTRAGFEFRTNPDKPKQSGVRKSISKKSWCWLHRWFCAVNQLVRSSTSRFSVLKIWRSSRYIKPNCTISRLTVRRQLFTFG